MRFYNGQRSFYCGVDLHARTMYLCIIDREGNTVLHRDVKARPAPLLRMIQPYRKGLVIGCECMFTWYWLADLCAQEGIEFILGHALYLRAIHGGKSKNDRIDSRKLARLMRGGTFPLSYVYPAEMRSTRDLMRRRMFLMRRRSELLAHIHMTYQQYNLDCPQKRLRYAGNRDGLTDRFDDGSVKKMITEASPRAIATEAAERPDRLGSHFHRASPQAAMRHSPGPPRFDSDTRPARFTTSAQARQKGTAPSAFALASPSCSGEGRREGEGGRGSREGLENEGHSG